jgi:hypothetical protein
VRPSLQAAGPDQIALAMDPRYGDGIAQGQAQAAIVWPGADWRGDGAEGRDLRAARAAGDGRASPR